MPVSSRKRLFWRQRPTGVQPRMFEHGFSGGLRAAALHVIHLLAKDLPCPLPHFLHPACARALAAQRWWAAPLIAAAAVALTACDRKTDQTPPIGSPAGSTSPGAGTGAPGTPTMGTDSRSDGANASGTSSSVGGMGGASPGPSDSSTGAGTNAGGSSTPGADSATGTGATPGGLGTSGAGAGSAGNPASGAGAGSGAGSTSTPSGAGANAGSTNSTPNSSTGNATR